jgi:hypothetical protein
MAVTACYLAVTTSGTVYLKCVRICVAFAANLIADLGVKNGWCTPGFIIHELDMIRYCVCRNNSGRGHGDFLCHGMLFAMHACPYVYCFSFSCILCIFLAYMPTNFETKSISLLNLPSSITLYRRCNHCWLPPWISFEMYCKRFYQEYKCCGLVLIFVICLLYKDV